MLPGPTLGTSSLGILRFCEHIPGIGKQTPWGTKNKDLWPIRHQSLGIFIEYWLLNMIPWGTERSSSSSSCGISSMVGMTPSYPPNSCKPGPAVRLSLSHHLRWSAQACSSLLPRPGYRTAGCSRWWRTGPGWWSLSWMEESPTGISNTSQRWVVKASRQIFLPKLDYGIN